MIKRAAMTKTPTVIMVLRLDFLIVSIRLGIIDFKPYFSYNIPMSGIFVKTKKLILLFGDLALFYASLFLTLLILRFNTIDLGEWYDHLWAFSLFYFFLLIIFYVNELYDLEVAQNDLLFSRKIIESILIGAAVAIGLFYFTPIFGITP